MTQSLCHNTRPYTVREFTEAELDSATNSFSNIVGKGSFGCVYQGSLQHVPVAVKVMDPICPTISLGSAYTYTCMFTESSAGDQSSHFCGRSAGTYKVCVSCRCCQVLLYAVLQVATSECDQFNGDMQKQACTTLPLYGEVVSFSCVA